MPTITLRYEITALQAQMIEAMRGNVPREEFLRSALHLGLCYLQDDITRITKEMIYNGLAGQTKNYDKARVAFQLSAPGENPTQEAAE